MKITLSHTGVHLGTSEYICLIDGKGSRIECREGKVWITQGHEARDVLLEAGDAITLDQDGVTIVQGLTPADIALDAPSRKRPVAVHSTAITSLAVFGFVARRGASRRSGHALPTIERNRHVTSLAVLGFARRASPARNAHPDLASV